MRIKRKLDRQDSVTTQDHVQLQVDILYKISNYHLQQSTLFWTSLVLLMIYLPSFNLYSFYLYILLPICYEGTLLERFGSKGIHDVTKMIKYVIIYNSHYPVFDFRKTYLEFYNVHKILYRFSTMFTNHKIWL